MTAAGLAAFQNEKYWFFLGARRTAEGVELFLEKDAGKGVTVVARQNIGDVSHLTLHITGDGG